MGFAMVGLAEYANQADSDKTGHYTKSVSLKPMGQI